MQLNHLHLHVRDLERSHTFYERWFGFREHTRHGAILFLRDDADLDLALAPADDVETMPVWFHFGFRLPSASAVQSLHAAMSADGVAMVMEFQQWDDFAVYRCQDPDGYSIEVYWES